MTTAQTTRDAAAEFILALQADTRRWGEPTDDGRSVLAVHVDSLAALLASYTAAAVERERERCAAYCEKRAADEKRDAMACAEVSLSGCHDVGAYDRGRIEALRDAASALRSRPPRAGEGGSDG